MRRQWLGQRVFGFACGDLVEAGDGHEPSSGAGRLELSQWHFLYAPEEPFNLLALTERDDGLLPTGGVADRPNAAQAAPALAAHGDRVDVSDLDALGLVLVLQGLLHLALASTLRNPQPVP